MTKKKTHRGRLQAQGGGLEASETWEQGEPLSKKAGLSLLEKLRAKLSFREQQLRKRPFEEAERFIRQADGVDAPLRKTFRNRKTKDVRVDIEVWGGTAFVSIILILILLWKFL
jgi:hypothetical protein